jgi:hypothetical protein
MSQGLQTRLGPACVYSAWVHPVDRDSLNQISIPLKVGTSVMVMDTTPIIPWLGAEVHVTCLMHDGHVCLLRASGLEQWRWTNRSRVAFRRLVPLREC